ncbi:MAG TPA: ClpXP protease specificity-enhancing factor SspB [Rhizomicrobium sp.]|jgi:hypothetical protein
MAKDYIGYQALTDAALRSVVRDALLRIEKQGLIGSHHFYITFKTHFPGVDIPDFLKEQYPDEMTIILQHQFWGLKVKEEYFEVALSFRKLPATLTIPFAALTAFFDPGVQFGLQFKGEDGESKANLSSPVSALHAALPMPKENPPAPLPPPTKAENADEVLPTAPGEVVNLDAFRKK